MISRGTAVYALCCLAAIQVFCRTSWAAQAQQQMFDFSLSGFGEKGKKSWDVFGKSADISSDVIKLFDIESTLYGARETIRLTADTGDFNRNQGLLRLKKNVTVESSSGATLTTDMLDWDEKLRLVSTKESIQIRRQDLTITGKGAEGLQDLKLLTVEKNVRVVSSASVTPQQEIVITCDGPMTIDYTQNKAVFENNVLVTTPDGTLHSRMMDVFLASKGKTTERRQDTGSSIETIIARGDVTVTRGENVSRSQEAVYRAAEHAIILTGKPEIILYPSEVQGAPTGN